MTVAKRVLVCDDDPNLSKLLKTTLERMLDVSVTTVPSGLDALELLEKEQFDLMVLDHLMPNIDGLETLKRLRNSPAGKEMPVLFYSAIDLRIVAVREGANQFLRKPSNVTEISRTCAGLLGIGMNGA
ncbi:MAG: response regulator [Deltaproteobacteria bacterium]|nr:response regulator [Deltaproteobacteria bacterium]